MNSSIVFPLTRNLASCAFVSFKFLTCNSMNRENDYSYKGAIYALNGLQSNYAYLQKAQETKREPTFNLTTTISHLHTLGIEIESLNNLNVIHVSGTKGKGSTCAFSESILRHHGLKTGFYSSPHLMSVNERIRINGVPLEKELFSQYFWHVYDTLQKSLKNDQAMPSYFMFLTIMGYYVFLKEQVDVAIIEVGIGGSYDCTNIIQKPVCVGVTTLDLDHVQLLGNTLAEIAKQKSGIFKQSVPAFTVPQPKDALDVMETTAQALNCPLTVIPSFTDYKQVSTQFDFGLLGKVQDVNASLAIQLTKSWLSSIQPQVHKDSIFNLSPKFVKGLRTCLWPGRFQILKKDEVSFYVDGAHVEQSMKHCIKWFSAATQNEQFLLNRSPYRILVFNSTGQRIVEALLRPLVEFPFDLVIFCPNKIEEVQDASSDLSNFMIDPGADLDKCKQNQKIWCDLVDNVVGPNNGTFILKNNSNCKVFPCLKAALACIKDVQLQQTKTNQPVSIQVLVTGSLHLVGGVLSIINT